MELVSIGVPVYNAGKYLRECLQSLLDQTYTNWECIVNDNCSKDDSLAIAQEFASRDNRFKVFRNTAFIPAVNNWNQAFSHASENATYYKSLGADDFLMPEFLEKKVNLMDRYPSVGYCSSYRIQDRSLCIFSLDYRQNPVYDGKEILLGHLRNELFLTGNITTGLFRMSVLKKLAAYPKIYNEKNIHSDTELAYDVMAISDVGFLHQLLTFDRIHPATGTVQIANRFNSFILSRDIYLPKYIHIDPQVKHLYEAHRAAYANFIVKSLFTFKFEKIRWHYERMQQRLTVGEFLQGLIAYNPVVKRLRRRRINGATQKQEIDW